MCLPVPLLLWPIVGIFGSLLGGIGYGFFAPLLATFQAVGKGENFSNKFFHCFNVSENFCLCNHVSFYALFGSVFFNSNPLHDLGSDCKNFCLENYWYI